jgi:glucose dehydrogenase
MVPRGNAETLVIVWVIVPWVRQVFGACASRKVRVLTTAVVGGRAVTKVGESRAGRKIGHVAS